MNFRLVIFLFVSLFLFFEKSENNIIEYSQEILQYYIILQNTLAGGKNEDKSFPATYSKFINLTIITVKKCVLLNSTQEFMEIEAWQCLTFFHMLT